MRHHYAANISLTAVCLFVALSFLTGAKQYNDTRAAIVADLNQALREAVKQHADQWLCRDTIQSYTLLQKRMGTGVTLRTTDNVFAEALPEEIFRRNAGICVNVLPTGGAGGRSVAINENESEYIMSDTLMLMNSAKAAGAALSLRGFVYCPFVSVLKMTDLTSSVALFVAALCFGGLYFYFCRKEKGHETEQKGTAEEAHRLITFGDLSLSTDDSCIYDSGNRRLNLTPMEYSLMEMFYLSSSHFLLKKDICAALWPGKDNADETLYALVRRLKHTLSAHSSIQISAVRGRAYQLDDSVLG